MRPNRHIALTFAKRQTPDSRFSHFEGTEQELIKLVGDSADAATQGYRAGVYEVQVPPDRFKSGIVQLKEGDKLTGVFKARQTGEDPRKVVVTEERRTKLPAKYVEVILYHRTVLEEEAGYEAVADWEIISINASPTNESTPIPPDALIANHFNLSGGTSTKYTPEEFEKALAKSVRFWKDKVLCG